MRYLRSIAARLATLLVLQAARVGLASPTVLVTTSMLPSTAATVEWLPKDNQTVYRLNKGEIRRLELNSTSIVETPLYLTVSPCECGIHWSIYHSIVGAGEGALRLIRQYKSDDTNTFTTVVTQRDRYVLELSSIEGGAVAVSTRGESPKTVRLRLRVRSKRRLAANWDPSPIDPQATSYCVVASYRRNYTSLCAAQSDKLGNSKANPGSVNDKINILKENGTRGAVFNDVDNKIDRPSGSMEENLSLDLYEGNFKNYYRRKKFSRSTKVTDDDPMVACVGDRTSHLIENLDPIKTYHVSVYGIGRDRRAGTLLGANSVNPRTSTAKRLRENVSYKAEIKGGKLVFYYKAIISADGGIWLSVSTCGGIIDIEVLARGKRLNVFKNVDSHVKFFVPSPMPASSIQDTSDESSVQFDSSSSEETRLRYVIKITPSQKELHDNTAIGVELIASTSRWGMNMPELAPHDGSVVRELRPRRSCRSVDVAFLPAMQYSNDVIRYCISTRETVTAFEDISTSFCPKSKLNSIKTQCISHTSKSSAKVIIHRINGLRAGRKYAIQITASTKGSSVPYNILYADTDVFCNRK